MFHCSAMTSIKRVSQPNFSNLLSWEQKCFNFFSYTSFKFTKHFHSAAKCVRSCWFYDIRGSGTHIADQCLQNPSHCWLPNFRRLPTLVLLQHRGSRPYIEIGGQFQALTTFTTENKSACNHNNLPQEQRSLSHLSSKITCRDLGCHSNSYRHYY